MSVFVRQREGIREEGGRDQLMSLLSNRAINRNRQPRRLIMILTPSICRRAGRSRAVPDSHMLECGVECVGVYLSCNDNLENET